MISLEEINKYASKLFGKNFNFRKGQSEAIQHVIENTVTNVKLTILEAPTGSGKSIIAIIVAYILAQNTIRKHIFLYQI